MLLVCFQAMPDGFKLFVGCLPSDITPKELETVFGKYGEVEDVNILKNQRQKSGNALACAFVTYSDRDAAEDAITVLDNKYKIRENGKEIKVQWPKSSDRGGGGGGSRSDVKPGMERGSGSSSAHDRDSRSSRGGAGEGRSTAKTDGQFGDSWDGRGSEGGDKGGGSSGIRGGKLFVGNLPPDIDIETIEYVFKRYGTLEKVRIMLGRAQTDSSSAFLEYADAEEAETAVLTLHAKYEMREGDGPIIVKWANSDRPRPY
ncbi:unnamed protein product [Polarella glacialis]|uniref:RRM domain-containing protein n=1 Tax=Polarella glacialis TaxID=89957 RepID=A0A813K6B1_POLGL|nr:unnamed protein product [Polarella glacialis]CAE8698279.1 unnamed protein product [Polarella glacialis]